MSMKPILEQRYIDRGEFLGGRVRVASFVPTSIVRYVYYAFIFSLPLEKADIEIGGFPLPKYLG